MIKIAIVEDEDSTVQEIQRYLERYAEEKGVSFQVTRFADGEDIVIGYKPNFDIIFMDIEMQFMDGMTAARNIREKDSEVVIVFVTNMAQYAIKGYQVDALDYVVKPVNYFGFSRRLDRAVRSISQRCKFFITVPIRGGDLQKIEVGTICYVESQGRDLFYHTESDVIQSYGTLKCIEETLTPYHFFRCNKGYLINMEHVSGIRDGCVVVGGDQLLISRPRKAVFMEELAKYIGKVIK